MSFEGFDLLTVLGCTATGKTRLAVALAERLDGEIISADSRQVFRGMDIGTGKDLEEYGNIPYHLIDIMEPGGEFSLFSFQQCFTEAYEAITDRGRLPILCGGSGLYLDAVLRGYHLTVVPEDPAFAERFVGHSDQQLAAMLVELRPNLHNSTDLLDRRRIIRALEIAMHEGEGELAAFQALRHLVIGIRFERSEIRRRITERLRRRLDSGMIEEVQRLLDEGVSRESLNYYGLEYRHISAYLAGEVGRNDMFQRLNSAIHDFAKRQENWYRKMERNGVAIQWLDGSGDLFEQALTLVVGQSNGLVCKD